MPEVYLGELEQIVLLAVLRLGDEAYAVPILEQIEAQTGRKVARGALYTALERLEAKGCLRSRVGDPLPERGGRARRYFTVTPAAVRALKASRLALMRLWNGLESTPMKTSPQWLLSRARHAIRDRARDGPRRPAGSSSAARRGAGTGARPCPSPRTRVARRTASDGEPRQSGDFFMRIFLNDVKYAWRSLFKRPLLTATVALTLALGLGANAAIFNLIDRLVLRPFPRVDPDNVVMIAETGPRLSYRRETTSRRPTSSTGATSADTVTHMSAMAWWDANLVEREDPERLQGAQVSSGLLRRARHPARARPRLRARRRDLRPPSRRRR